LGNVVGLGVDVGNDGELAHAWCLAGHGVALKSLRDVDADLHAAAHPD
jgi:hypothetical protein